jgi:ribonuclease H2 subunit A
MPIDIGEYYNTWKNMKKVYSSERDFDKLREQMTSEIFDDSKQLKAFHRESILERINECKAKGYLIHETRVISALEISELMTRDKPTNLNKMSHETVVLLIKRLLTHGINITRVFVDTVGPPAKYEKFLESQFPGSSKSF